MAEIIKFKDFQDFINSNIDFLSENEMLSHHLFESIIRVKKGQEPLRNFFNIKEGEKHIACLHIENEFLVYGNGYTDKMIKLLDSEIDFSKFKRFTFSGTKEIIEALFKPYDFQTETQKHRIIYRCDAVTPMDYVSGHLEGAQLYHLEELEPYGVEFSREYFGFENKNQEEMRAGTLKSILAGHMYIWVDNEKIVSMIQTMFGEGYPVIGFFYTPPPFRGKGYGTSILHQVTKGLLDVGNEYVMLTADAFNQASNKAFQNVGYKNTGEYLRVWKEKLT